MHTKKTMLILLALLLAASACSPAATAEPTAAAVEPTVAPPTDTPEPAGITLTDGLGREITLEETAERIISLAPSNTEILFALEAGDKIVGRDTFSDYPAEAQNIPDIGGGFSELNTELIVSQNPDLVLAADLTPQEQIQALEDLGLKVFALSNPTDFEGLYVNLDIIAQLVGKETESAALIESLKGRVAAVEERVALAESAPLVFYELDSTDPNAPWTTGPGTFIDTLIKTAGGENMGASLGDAWVQVSIEELIAQDPDIIILGDYTWGGVTPEDVAARAGWDALSAVQNGRVYPFDDNLVSRPGPRLVDGLEAMAKLLHPDLFE